MRWDAPWRDRGRSVCPDSCEHLTHTVHKLNSSHTPQAQHLLSTAPTWKLEWFLYRPVELHIFALCLLIAQAPVVHSALSQCLIVVFPSLLYHIPCRNMHNDSLLLTSAEQHFAQTCAHNLATRRVKLIFMQCVHHCRWLCVRPEKNSVWKSSQAIFKDFFFKF